jgi:hypothetical protein|tara:strand:+ start:1191 stop:1517 length:327 start_codon:yes stop_codon:yes gene_type:complete
MEKFLSIPVLDAGGTLNQNQLVSITGIKTIGQPTTTTATINYLDGETTTLTWPTAYASPKLKIDVQNAVVSALKAGWTTVTASYLPKGATVSSYSGLVVNPLSTIAIA